MKTLRKTKIVCTIGPASQDKETMKNLVLAGMNVMRMNFSHGAHEDHLDKINKLRQINEELNTNVALMLDTKGPEIRTHKFEFGGTTLIKDSLVRISMSEVLGNSEVFSVTHANLINDVKVGGTILVDDGNVELTVVDKDFEKNQIICQVRNDAYVKDRRGINVPDVKLSLDFISPRDKADIEFGCDQHVDFIAASFVRRASDVLEIREILKAKNTEDIQIVSKIENMEAVNNLDEIIAVSDALMVARGDLGVEVPAYEVPIIQKEIIQKGMIAGKPVIVATQMLESMQKNPRPTRAEVNDVATAVLSGADAIMLSGETAAGLYPIESVKMMNQIATRMESEVKYEEFLDLVKKSKDHDINSCIASSVVYATNHLNASCIISPTLSGITAKRLSKYRPPVPIVAVTLDSKIMRSLALTWGVHPLKGEFLKTTDEVLEASIGATTEAFGLENGELTVIISNMPLDDTSTHSNMMKIHTINK